MSILRVHKSKECLLVSYVKPAHTYFYASLVKGPLSVKWVKLQFQNVGIRDIQD